MIDWNILRDQAPVDIAGNFTRGFQMGSAIVDKVHERNALGALAANPDDQGALAKLYAANPQTAGYMEQRGLLRRKALLDAQDRQRQATLGHQYTTDPAGARTAAIDAGDFDLAAAFGKLDESTQKRAADFWEKAGPIAFKLKQTTDPAARQALWQQARPILHSEGIDGSMLDKFDPTNEAQLDAAITTSQKMSDLVNQGKIVWHQQGVQPSFATDEMGHPIGSQNPYAKGPAATPMTGGKLTSAQAWHFIMPHEGGYAAHDGNGAPVNLGINQAANPDVDVSKLTPQAAQQLFEKRYWGPSGAGNLPAPLAAVHADTFFINPAKAKSFLQESDGDPQKYMDLREAWMQSLVKQPKFARFGEAWDNRNHDLREFSSEMGGGHGASSGVQVVSDKAAFDALPSGTMFIAPDGSKRVKP